jgi:hypothetical protein
MYLETIADAKGRGHIARLQEPGTVVHEVGHLLLPGNESEDHAQGGIMDPMLVLASRDDIRFSLLSLETIRSRAFK